MISFPASAVRTFAVLGLLLAAPAAAQTAAPQRPATFTLANGLDVVVIPDRRTPVVTQMIWYKVGSADETPGKSGLAHFLEHLMFKGTNAHPAGEFSQLVSRIGGNENAFTSYDYTGIPSAAAGPARSDGRRGDRYRPRAAGRERTGRARRGAEEYTRVATIPTRGSPSNHGAPSQHPYGRPVIAGAASSKLERETRWLLPPLLCAEQRDAGDRGDFCATRSPMVEATFGKIAPQPAIPPSHPPAGAAAAGRAP